MATPAFGRVTDRAGKIRSRRGRDDSGQRLEAAAGYVAYISLKQRRYDGADIQRAWQRDHCMRPSAGQRDRP
jgi:hypothetical protein